MKARAERFGIPFNPNAAASSTRTKPPSTSTKPVEPAPAAAAPAQKERAGAIDKTPLGISEDVLARRAAKFGIPEKKEQSTKESTAPAAKPASTSAPKPEVELTP